MTDRLVERRTGDPTLNTIAAVDDLVDGLRHWRSWATFAWYDIKQRYRRTLIGPFWITLSMGVFILMLGVIYGAIFQLPRGEYLPYLSAGMVTWFFVHGAVLESTTVFTAAASLIKQGAMPLSTYIYRVTCRNVIILAHNLVVVLAVVAIFRPITSLSLPAIVAGGVLLVGNLVVVSIVFAILSTRFRDVPPLVASALQVLFYVTPILYEPRLLPGHLHKVADWNPLYHVIDVFRRPLIGESPATTSYATASATLIVGVLVAFLLFRRYRRRIAYWL